MPNCSLGHALAGSSWTLRAYLLNVFHQQKLIFFSSSFYGINLNQNVVLQQIGFDGKTGTPWERMFKVSIGGIIITVLGFVPGM
jgi:hypothetical protein